MMEKEQQYMTIAEIKQTLKEYGVDCTLFGDAGAVVAGFSDPKDYLPGTAVWIGSVSDVVLSGNLLNDDIALVFAKPEAEAEKVFPNVLVTDNPKFAFMKLVYETYRKEPEESIDRSAMIAGDAIIGEKCTIGRNVIIGPGSVIGNACVICENAYIGENCFIGDGCVIGQGAVIGSENNGSAFVDSDGIMKNMPNVGKIVIGSHVLIGATTIISRGTFNETRIGDECMLNAGTAVGHNCKIGRRTMLLGRCTISGNTVIGENCQLISAAVKNRITIGNNVKVGIGSVVIKDIGDGKTVMGNPARVIPG